MWKCFFSVNQNIRTFIAWTSKLLLNSVRLYATNNSIIEIIPISHQILILAFTHELNIIEFIFFIAVVVFGCIFRTASLISTACSFLLFIAFTFSFLLLLFFLLFLVFSLLLVGIFWLIFRILYNLLAIFLSNYDFLIDLSLFELNLLLIFLFFFLHCKFFFFFLSFFLQFLLLIRMIFLHFLIPVTFSKVISDIRMVMSTMSTSSMNKNSVQFIV